MAASRLARRVEADDGPVNIQLGIFIPPQTTNNRKRPSKKPITTEPESKNDEKQRSELNGRTGRKRKRLDSGDSVDEKTIDTPEAEETENDTESEENDGEETSGKAKRKRKRRKKKRKLTREGTSSDSKEKALEYLASWESGSPGWAFRKKSQYWLLKNAYDRHKIPKAEFKTLLRYLDQLKGNQRQLAAVRAQEILSHGGHSDGDSSETTSSSSSRIHKRARAVFKVVS